MWKENTNFPFKIYREILVMVFLNLPIEMESKIQTLQLYFYQFQNINKDSIKLYIRQFLRVVAFA
jgi:hypothetical protein